MSAAYGQFCPVAKASEVFATRWTPLIVRELLSGGRSFNDILRGVPLISRAVLVSRLRELEQQGIVERCQSAGRDGKAYRLTAAGEDFRSLIDALDRWGRRHSIGRIEPSELDPALLMTGLGRRASACALPVGRRLLRFEFSGVPATRTKFRIMWMILNPSGVDVCAKDPGFEVDLILRGPIEKWVALYLGHDNGANAKDLLEMDGDPELARHVVHWLKSSEP